MNWLLLQLADSAFPSGAFAHSAGLESLVQHGEINSEADLLRFISELLAQTGNAVIPLANAAHDAPETWPELDQRCDAFLSNHVANRASRSQGRALLTTCQQVFPFPEIQVLKQNARRLKLSQHHAPAFGVTLRALGVSKDEMLELLLFATLRGTLSAAVRLNLLGPLRAQHLQFQFTLELDTVADRCRNFTLDDLAQTAPLLDLFQTAHDRLYSRLFHS